MKKPKKKKKSTQKKHMNNVNDNNSDWNLFSDRSELLLALNGVRLSTQNGQTIMDVL